MPASHQAMIFSTKFCKENKFNINFIIAGDYDLYLKISKSDRATNAKIEKKTFAIIPFNHIKMYIHQLSKMV